MLDQHPRPGGGLAEQQLEAAQDLTAPGGSAECAEPAGVGPGDESEQYPGAAARRRIVEREVHRRPVAVALTVEALAAPERLVVDGLELDHRTLRHALGQLIA